MSSNSKSSTDNPSLRFWAIIAEAKQDEKALARKLETMPRDEIVEFYREFLNVAAELQCPPYTDELNGKSEDAIADLAECAVSKGKDYYSEIIEHPERIPTTLPMNSPSIKGTALTVFWDRFGESIPAE